MRPPKYEATQGALSSSSSSNVLLQHRLRRRSLISQPWSLPAPVSIGRPRASEDVDLAAGSHEDGTDQGGAQAQIQGLQEYLLVLSPQRLSYEIQMASGWEAGFPPEELVGLMQTSVGKGWHTPRFCQYPQDLVLRFSCGHARITKIQILSHHFKIANKLDFWIGARKGVTSVVTETQVYPSMGDYDDKDGQDYYGPHPDSWVSPEEKQIPVLQFEKLGSITFDNNEGSNFSGRELRSINFDVEGEYLRVVIRQCHANHLNIYHQAAILALNILGEPLDDELDGESQRIVFDEFQVVNGPGFGNTDLSIPILGGQAPATATNTPNMSALVTSRSVAEIKDHTVNFLDKDMQRLVAGFSKAKIDAVKVEDFQLAKALKSNLSDILKFASEIQLLDIEKQGAVERDDFDLADELKAKVTEVKQRVDSHLQVKGFVIAAEGDDLTVSTTSCSARQLLDAPFTLSPKPSGMVTALTDQRNSSTGSIRGVGERKTSHRRSTPSSTVPERYASSTSETSSDPDRLARHSLSSKLPTSQTNSTAPRSRSIIGPSRIPNSPSDQFLQLSKVGLQNTQSPPQPSREYKSTGNTSVIIPLSRDMSFGLSQVPIDDGKTIDETLEMLSASDKKDFSAALLVFSPKVITSFINKDLRLRLLAIEVVREYLENESGTDEVEQQNEKSLLAQAVFQIVVYGLADTREKVVVMLLLLLDQVVRFCLQNEVAASTAYGSLEPVLPLLLVKAADLNPRVAQATVSRIVMLCNSYRSHPYSVLPLVFRPSRSTVVYRQAQARVEVVTRLVDEFGVYDRTANKGTAGGLDFGNIIEFSIPYLSHTNGEVRIATRRLIVDICKFLNKTRVEQFLPGVKPLIVESIQKELEPKKSTSRITRSSTPDAALSIPDVPAPSQSKRISALPTSKHRPTPVGVDLHMDSLKSLLTAPDSPGLSRGSGSRSKTKPKSDAALAHQMRLKMPLRTLAKASQSVYTGVPKSATRRQIALSPDDGNDSTSSESTKAHLLPLPPAIVPRTAIRPLQPKARTGSRPQLHSQPSQSDLHGAHGRTSSQESGQSASKSSSSRLQAVVEPTEMSRSVKDRFCIFCDQRSSAFTDEGLVTHYWSDCPMLANCSYCKIIIEIPTLADHMLQECSRRKFVKQCEQCREIMAADDYLSHVANRVCVALPETTKRCPLCQLVVSPNDEPTWKAHLMKGTGCPKSKKWGKKLIGSQDTAPLTSKTTTSVRTGFSPGFSSSSSGSTAGYTYSGSKDMIAQSGPRTGFNGITPPSSNRMQNALPSPPPQHPPSISNQSQAPALSSDSVHPLDMPPPPTTQLTLHQQSGLRPPQTRSASGSLLQSSSYTGMKHTYGHDGPMAPPLQLTAKASRLPGPSKSSAFASERH